MSKIWKFPIEPQPGPPGADYATAEITIPFSHRLLHVDIQDGKPVLWALIEPNFGEKKVGFYVVPTGVFLPPERYLGGYVGTWQHDGDVWHLFRSQA